MIQQRQNSAGQERPSDLQLHYDKLTPSLGDIEKLEIKGLTLTDEQGEDFSYSSIGSDSISSMPSIGWEEELKRYEDQMPTNIKTDYFDALILYADNEEDRIAAEQFQNHLINEIDIGKNGPVTAMLYNCPELEAFSGSKIGHLEAVVERSTYVFMYLTEHFVKDKWMELSSESCLMNAIDDDDKRWCVVPVYTQIRAKRTFKIPMGLNSLKGINYFNNNEFYRRGVARLIIDMVPQKKLKNEQLKMKKKQWLEKQKRMQFECQEQQKRVEFVEEQKTAETVQLSKDETERCIQNGMIPGFQHSHSESHLSAPDHPLPQTRSAESFEDIHSQNQPHFSALLSHNSPNQSSSPYNSGGYNSVEITAICNQQEGILPVSTNTTARTPTAYQEKHMEDEEEDREVTKEKKITSSKTEKLVHYTIYVRNANAVQVGNQNIVQSSTCVEPNSGDASDNERESFPVNVIGTSRREQESTEPSHLIQVLKKDPAEGQGIRAETDDQQQPTQGTTDKTIVEEDTAEASDNQVTNIHTSPETTNQLPEGIGKLLCGESNLKASTSVEQSSFKDKVIIEKVTYKETNEIEKNAGGDLKKQDSKFKSENNPAVTIISPKRPKILSESGEGIELKEVVQSDQTNLKYVVTESNESRAIHYLGTQPQTAKETVQLLRQSAEDCDREQFYSNIDNTVYSPGVGASANISHEVPGTRDNEETFSTWRKTNPTYLFYQARVSPVPSEIDALSSSSNQVEGTVSTSGGRSTSRPKGKPKTKGLPANKQCVIS